MFRDNVGVSSFCRFLFLLSLVETSVRIPTLKTVLPKNDHPYAELICHARLSIPHFLTPHYTIPYSDLGYIDGCQNNMTLRSTLNSDPSQFRLSSKVKPLHYQVTLCPRLEFPFDFNGSVDIDLKLDEVSTSITLNINGLLIKNVKIKEYSEDHPLFLVKKNESLTDSIREGRKIDTGIEYIQNYYQTLFNISFEERLRRFFNKINLKNQNKSSNKNKVSLIEENERNITVRETTEDEYFQKITFHTIERLKPGKIYRLSINYYGYLGNDLKGLYKYSYWNKNGKRRYLAVTQFQVSDARRAFPCFDEPGFKSTFKITLCRSPNDTAVSNMPKKLTFVRPDSPELVWDEFETTPLMSTYLVAFAIFDYKFINCPNSNVPFKVWVPETSLNFTNFACDVSPPLLDFFADYFNYSFPLPKIDFVGLSQFFASGMENWGLVTFLYDRLLVHDTERNSIASVNTLETISHELAHQWFGNLVTPFWWSDIWLNEGFATFLSILGADHIMPKWKKMEQYIVEIKENVLSLDSFQSSHPIIMNVSHPKDYFSVFDEIAYGKGCFVIRMIMHVLSEKTFQRGLQLYLRRYQYQSATQEDLWQTMTEISHRDGTFPKYMTVAEVMNSWITQTGHPLVTILRLDNRTGIVKQKRNFFERDEEFAERASLNHDCDDSLPKWWVPLSFATKDNIKMADTMPKYWLNESHSTLIINKMPPLQDWYLINVQQTGFFRVNYDIENWRLLSKQLKKDHLVFDDMTRAQLLSDSFALAYSDHLEYEIPLSIFEYLEKESSPHVLKLGIETSFAIMNSFSHDNIYGSFKELLSTTFRNQLPLSPFELDEHLLPIELSNNVVFVKYFCFLYPRCVREAHLIYDQWNQHKANYSIVNKDFLETVLCIAVSEGGEKEWETIWKEYESVRYPEYIDVLLNVLGCTRHRWLLSRFLYRVSNKYIATQELTSTFAFSISSIAKNPIGIDHAWEFFRTIWTRVSNTTDGDLLIESIFPHLRTSIQLQEASDFLQYEINGQEDNGKKTYFNKILLNLRRKIDYQIRNYEELIIWFQGRKKRLFSNSDFWKARDSNLR